SVLRFYSQSDDAKTHQLKKPVAHARRLGRSNATWMQFCTISYSGLKAITQAKSLYSRYLRGHDGKHSLFILNRDTSC
ncbi:MAG TPA: hypothetical protein H9874_11335, partial [Candidatus Bilophila faecipullorum]|nr:hypothetical protein [Candidatus Bilophila faecipullorum]